MALQICPQCKQRYFTWYIDEEESPLTQWNCSKCGYHATEDESAQRKCSVCSSPDESLLMIKDSSSQYWWCAKCNTVKPID